LFTGGEEMSRIRDLHSQAMDLAELAEEACRSGDVQKAEELYEQAFEYEEQAAERVVSSLDGEPTRSVLLRSAAALALNCNRLRDAERQIAVALAGNPPDVIAEELRDLLEQVYFKRHLDVRGITMAPGEFQLSIAGKAIGAGWALSDAFVERVMSTEKLVYRTAERILGRAFRDRGSADKSIRENFTLFLSPLRVGSLAVTFKLGRQKDPVLPGLESYMAEDYTNEVVEEVVECLQLINEADDGALRERIHDEAYYHNFIGLARQIAPDGENVNQVGFTVIRGNKEKRVALRRVQEEITSLKLARSSGRIDKPQSLTRVRGQLLFADHRKSERGIIELIDDKDPSKKYKIIVPEGMMSDIVRPLWEYTVVVTGRTSSRGIVLEDIKQAEE
jgi:hypothetical protein